MLEGVVIHTAPADHGDLSPTALCLVLDFEGIRVLCTGDTAFRPQALKPLVRTAARRHVAVHQRGVRQHGPYRRRDDRRSRPGRGMPFLATIGMFAEQGAGDPAGFIYACRHFCPGGHGDGA